MLELSLEEKNELSVLINMLKEKKAAVADAVYNLEMIKAQLDTQEKARIATLNNMQQTMGLITDKARMILQAHKIPSEEMDQYTVDIISASIVKK